PEFRRGRHRPVQPLSARGVSSCETTWVLLPPGSQDRPAYRMRRRTGPAPERTLNHGDRRCPLANNGGAWSDLIALVRGATADDSCSSATRTVVRGRFPARGSGGRGGSYCMTRPSAASRSLSRSQSGMCSSSRGKYLRSLVKPKAVGKVILGSSS